MKQIAIGNFEIKFEESEKYSRESCVRIHGLQQ